MSVGVTCYTARESTTAKFIGFTQIGWYAWGSALMAELFNELAGFPRSLNWLVILFFTYSFCTTAYIGYRGIDWLSRLAVPAMVVLMVWSLSIATRHDLLQEHQTVLALVNLVHLNLPESHSESIQQNFH